MMVDTTTKSATLGQSTPSQTPRIAVLVPCFNEALTVGKVVADFREQLPSAIICVCDNNSTDDTARIAREAGAVVIREGRQGKGFVVQTMFQAIDADVYVMVDGDGTYPASEVHRLIEPVLRGTADMAVGSRLQTGRCGAFRRLNLLGNRLFLSILNCAFRVRLTDILSGYRAFSRQFVKTIPLVGGGFEVETELTIKTLEAGYRIAEVTIDLGSRPAGSYSKIRPFLDGGRIFLTIFALFRDYKPLTFFGTLAILFVALGLVPGVVVIIEYFQTGLVPRLPSAVLAVGLVLMGMFMFTAGIILHSNTRRIRELQYQLRNLAVSTHSNQERPENPSA
jgi:glycosyltransferase involved in cell wall biosynthesis